MSLFSLERHAAQAAKDLSDAKSQAETYLSQRNAARQAIRDLLAHCGNVPVSILKRANAALTDTGDTNAS